MVPANVLHYRYQYNSDKHHTGCHHGHGVEYAGSEVDQSENNYQISLKGLWLPLLPLNDCEIMFPLNFEGRILGNTERQSTGNTTVP